MTQRIKANIKMYSEEGVLLRDVVRNTFSTNLWDMYDRLDNEERSIYLEDGDREPITMTVIEIPYCHYYCRNRKFITRKSYDAQANLDFFYKWQRNLLGRKTNLLKPHVIYVLKGKNINDKVVHDHVIGLYVFDNDFDVDAQYKGRLYELHIDFENNRINTSWLPKALVADESRLIGRLLKVCDSDWSFYRLKI